MPNDIDRDSLQEMYDEMRKNTSWNLDGEMLWGYFFTDPSEEKLVAAGEALAKLGYAVVGVDEAEEDDEHEHDENYDHDHEEAEEHVHGEGCDHDHDHDHDHGVDGVPMFVLQVEEVKHHTVDTLFARHREFTAFAEAHGLDTYDGIEVGEVIAASALS